nr:MAG TPA: hypothetical protein [Caudoviricetes sp.]
MKKEKKFFFTLEIFTIHQQGGKLQDNFFI